MRAFVSRHLPILTALLYGTVSTSITFFNKAVLSVYQFRQPNVMTLAQIVLSLIFLQGMKTAGWIQFADFEWSRARRVFPLAVSFIGMVLTGLSALNYLNVPMFSALRRVTTLVTMYCEWYLLNSIPSKKIQGSVYLMVVGGFIAAYYDLDYNFYGYLMVGINSFFTAAYLICIATFGKQGLDTFGLMFYNNILSLPLVLLVCVINGDVQATLEYEYLTDAGFWAMFFVSSVQAFLLNYSIFLCTKVNSALTTSVVGNLKNIFTTAFGYFAFNDVTYEFMNVFGVAIGTVAGAIYSWFQFTEEVEKKAATQAKAASAAAASGAALPSTVDSGAPATADVVHRHVAIGMPASGGGADASLSTPTTQQQQQV